VVMWQVWVASLAGVMGSDVAGLCALQGVVGGGGVNEPAPGWPKCRQSPGRSMAAVVVVRGKMEWSQHVTSVTYQPQLLDLATCRHLLSINSNYH